MSSLAVWWYESKYHAAASEDAKPLENDPQGGAECAQNGRDLHRNIAKTCCRGLFLELRKKGADAVLGGVQLLPTTPGTAESGLATLQESLLRFYGSIPRSSGRLGST